MMSGDGAKVNPRDGVVFPQSVITQMFTASVLHRLKAVHFIASITKTTCDNFDAGCP